MIGASTSALTFFSVLAAVLAVGALRSRWSDNFKNSTPVYLPGLTGGGSGFADGAGKLLSLWAPVFFFFMWLIVGVYVMTINFQIRVSASIG